MLSRPGLLHATLIHRLLLHNHNFNPTVYGPVAADAVVRNRFELAVGNRVHAVQRYSVLDVEVPPDCLSSGQAQHHIILFCAHVVRVSLDLDVDILVFRFQARSKTVESRFRFFGKITLVKAEMDCLVRKRHIIEKFALGYFASFLSPFECFHSRAGELVHQVVLI